MHRSPEHETVHSTALRHVEGLEVHTGVLEVVGIVEPRSASRAKAGFVAILDALSAVRATSHLSVITRWGGAQRPSVSLQLAIAVIDDRPDECRELLRYAHGALETASSPWSVVQRAGETLDWSGVRDVRFIRQARRRVTIGDDRSVVAPIRFRHPGVDSWDRLLSALTSSESPLAVAVTLTPTTLRPFEEQELDGLCRSVGDPPSSGRGERVAESVIDLAEGLRARAHEIQIAVLGEAPITDGRVGSIAASLTGAFDTHNGDGWRSVAGSRAPLTGGCEIEPARSMPEVIDALATGRPWLGGDRRTFSDLVTDEEASFLACWPIATDRTVPGLPISVPSEDVPVAVGPFSVTIGAGRDGAPVGFGGLDRTQHLAVLGGSGCGKSTVLTSLAVQDVAAGVTTWVIDASAETLSRVRCASVDSASTRLTVLDMVDATRSDSVNLLALGDEANRMRFVAAVHDGLVSDLPAEFHGPMGRTHLLAVLRSMAKANVRLADTLLMLHDSEFATEVCERLPVGDPDRSTILEMHAAPSTNTTELHRWLGSKPSALVQPEVSEVLGNSAPTRTLDDLLAPGAVVLIRPPHDASGSHLVTSVLIEVLAAAILGRSLADAPISLFLEEAQRAAGRSLRSLMNEARKRNVFVHLATQHLVNLDGEADAVLTNAATVLLGRSRGRAARGLEVEFGLEVGALASLPNLSFLAVVSAAGQPVGPVRVTVDPPTPIPDLEPVSVRGVRAKDPTPGPQVEAAGGRFE